MCWEITSAGPECCSFVNFWDNGLNEGFLARRRATEYETDGFKKSTYVDLGPFLISTFICNREE